MKEDLPSASFGQQVALVGLRTLIGWHFFSKATSSCYTGLES
jgi:hypothetical protein